LITFQKYSTNTFFSVGNNKEETKILKFSQNIPLIDSNESLVTINIEPDKFRGISFNPLKRTNKKWFVNLSETSIPAYVTNLLQLDSNFNLPEQ